MSYTADPTDNSVWNPYRFNIGSDNTPSTSFTLNWNNKNIADCYPLSWPADDDNYWYGREPGFIATEMENFHSSAFTTSTDDFWDTEEEQAKTERLYESLLWDLNDKDGSTSCTDNDRFKTDNDQRELSGWKQFNNYWEVNITSWVNPPSSKQTLGYRFRVDDDTSREDLYQRGGGGEYQNGRQNFPITTEATKVVGQENSDISSEKYGYIDYSAKTYT